MDKYNECWYFYQVYSLIDSFDLGHINNSEILTTVTCQILLGFVGNMQSCD